jgi:hypothetical protein
VLFGGTPGGLQRIGNGTKEGGAVGFPTLGFLDLAGSAQLIP